MPKRVSIPSTVRGSPCSRASEVAQDTAFLIWQPFNFLFANLAMPSLLIELWPVTSTIVSMNFVHTATRFSSVRSGYVIVKCMRPRNKCKITEALAGILESHFQMLDRFQIVSLWSGSEVRGSIQVGVKRCSQECPLQGPCHAVIGTHQIRR